MRITAGKRPVFEVHGLAPRNPRLFGGYIRAAIESWRAIIAANGHEEPAATAIVAAFDGLLMDFLATASANARRARSSWR